MKNKQDIKKTFLIFNGRFPSEKAASLFAMKSCEAFGKKGVPVTLLLPRRIGREKDNPFLYYKVEENFQIKYLPIIDLFLVPFVGKIAFIVGHITFGVSCLIYLFFNAKKEDIVYSNETVPLLFPAYFFPNTLYELHDFPEKNFWMYKKLFKNIRKILVTNKWKLKKIKEKFNISDEKLFYEANAVEIKDFDITLSQTDAREKLGLPLGKEIIVYTGHLYAWKGVDTLARAARLLDGKKEIYFVGGTDKDCEVFKKKYGFVTTIKIIGHRPHNEIPIWQKAADVLVLPNTAQQKISKYYTSPMKLFEYMASKTPIIASNIPSITEIVNEESALLVEPDDPEALQKAILWALSNEDIMRKRAEQAFKDVLKHSWDKRAERILKILE